MSTAQTSCRCKHRPRLPGPPAPAPLALFKRRQCHEAPVLPSLGGAERQQGVRCPQASPCVSVWLVLELTTPIVPPIRVWQAGCRKKPPSLWVGLGLSISPWKRAAGRQPSPGNTFSLPLDTLCLQFTAWSLTQQVRSHLLQGR